MYYFLSVIAGQKSASGRRMVHSLITEVVLQYLGTSCGIQSAFLFVNIILFTKQRQENLLASIFIYEVKDSVAGYVNQYQIVTDI